MTPKYSIGQELVMLGKNMTVKSFCVGSISLRDSGITYDAAYPDSHDILRQMAFISLTPAEEKYDIKEVHLFETKEDLKEYRVKTISAL